MSQGHMRMNSEDRERLAAARDWLKGHFTEDADNAYVPVDGKLRLIDTILKNGWIGSEETWKLQALGVGFGDALEQKLLLEWVAIEDEYGRDPALNWPGTSIYTYPLTAISKRVERGDTVDVVQLFESACKMLSDMVNSGRYP